MYRSRHPGSFNEAWWSLNLGKVYAGRIAGRCGRLFVWILLLATYARRRGNESDLKQSESVRNYTTTSALGMPEIAPDSTEYFQ